MSAYDLAKELKETSVAIENDISNIINNLEFIDGDYEIEDILEVIENVVSKLEDIKGDIY